MSADTLFSLGNLLVLPGWALLVFLPRWKWTLGLISAGIIPFVLGLAYIGILLTQGMGGEDGGGFGSLQAVSILFGNPYALAAGWIHYLAFDLFVGSWEVHDARQRGVPHWMVIPCLALTFLFGPAGLALYLVVRAMKTSRTWIYDPVSA